MRHHSIEQNRKMHLSDDRDNHYRQSCDMTDAIDALSLLFLDHI